MAKGEIALLLCGGFLVGCAAKKESEPYVPVVHTREVLVQTIPRGAYISRNHEYIGVAPIVVTVRSTSSGRPVSPTRIRATDTPTGSFVEKILNPIHQVPEKMLLDIRPWLHKPPVGKDLHVLSWQADGDKKFY
jgi:hypothetical protein